MPGWLIGGLVGWLVGWLVGDGDGDGYDDDDDDDGDDGDGGGDGDDDPPLNVVYDDDNNVSLTRLSNPVYDDRGVTTEMMMVIGC